MGELKIAQAVLESLNNHLIQSKSFKIHWHVPTSSFISCLDVWVVTVIILIFLQDFPSASAKLQRNYGDIGWTLKNHGQSLVVYKTHNLLLVIFSPIFSRKKGLNYGFRIVFVFWLRFCFCFLLSFLVPFTLYLQQFGTRTCHFAWCLLHFGMATLHFAWYLLHLAIFAFHSAWYLPRFGTSTSHLHGICYILVLQTFMWVSWEFL